MFDVFTKIGWAAGDIHRHAHRLTIDREDPPGSAAVEDEEQHEEREERRTTVNEDEFLDEDDLDDQPRSRRGGKQQQLVDRLKSDNDKLLDELKKRDRTLEDMSSRLMRIEHDRTERETRADVNRRSDAMQADAEREGRELASRVSALDRTDPEYSTKVYTLIAEHNQRNRMEDAERILQEVDRRSSAAVTRRMTQQELYEDSRKKAMAHLEEVGLGKELVSLVEDLAVAKTHTDPDWFKRTPDADQIPLLVSDLKERLMKSKRSSQAFQDDKRQHRADMDGVLGDGSRNARRGRTQEEQGDEGDENHGPGSILSDLTRMRKMQRQDTQAMLRRR